MEPQPDITQIKLQPDLHWLAALNSITTCCQRDKQRPRLGASRGTWPASAAGEQPWTLCPILRIRRLGGRVLFGAAGIGHTIAGGPTLPCPPSPTNSRGVSAPPRINSAAPST